MDTCTAIQHAVELSFDICQRHLIVSLIISFLVGLIAGRVLTEYDQKQSREKKPEKDEVQQLLRLEREFQIEEENDGEAEGRLFDEFSLGPRNSNTSARVFLMRGRHLHRDGPRVQRIIIWSEAPFEEYEISSPNDDDVLMLSLRPVSGSMTNVFYKS